MFEPLIPLLGGEHTFAAVCSELRTVARTSGATAVGAAHVTCSDESEYECADAFRRDFCQEVLPRLKYGAHVPFRMANPGARYEWGCAAVAQDHFMTASARRGWLLMVVKVNTHVGVMRTGPDGIAFGRMDRYGDESSYCGAVHATLAGARIPFVESLASELRSDGLDRLAILRDEAVVAPHLSPLYGAIATARLHARRVAQDVQDLTRGMPDTRLAYLVLHGVTLNHSGMDTELLGGAYLLDRRKKGARDTYCGLGDDPRAYVLEEHGGRIRVTDNGCEKPRRARDHRRLAGEQLDAMRAELGHPGVREAVQDARTPQGTARQQASALLKPVLHTLAELTPVPAALFLFAEGLVGVHHVVRLHRAGDASARAEAARDVVEAFEAQLDELSAEDAARILDRLQQATNDTVPR